MPRHRLVAPLAAALALASAADAASLTPPNLVTASSLNDPDLLLVWPYAAGGPLEAMSWSTFKTQLATSLTGQFLTPSANLGDLANPSTARTNLGLGSIATGNAGTSGNVFCALSSTCTHSGEELLAASTSTSAGLNLAPGVAPSAPANGDVWTTSSGVFAQINGGTVQLIAGASGSWTPTISFAVVGNLSVSYTNQTGYYTKVGNSCIVYYALTFTPNYTTASGNIIVQTLPVGAVSTSGVNNSGSGIIGNWSGISGVSNTIYEINRGTTGIQLAQGANIPLTVTNFPSGTQFQIYGEYTYSC